MTPSENECREAFEKWANETGEYAYGSAGDAWRGWQAAWNARAGQDAEDARRYRWLRSNTDGDKSNRYASVLWSYRESGVICDVDEVSGEQLDRLIDSTISK